MSRPLEALISVSEGSSTNPVLRPPTHLQSPRSGDGAIAPHPLDVELEHAEQFVQQQAQDQGGEGAPAPPQTINVPATSPFSIACRPADVFSPGVVP